MRVIYEGECCEDCILLLANGECGTGEESDAQMARIQNVWTPEEVQHMCAACDEDCEGPFSWRPCECCESPLGGSRHRFVVLGPDAPT